MVSTQPEGVGDGAQRTNGERYPRSEVGRASVGGSVVVGGKLAQPFVHPIVA
jgi:hypothetical protein